MLPRLYTDLAQWWPCLCPPGEFAEEAGVFREALERVSMRPVRDVLEMGCGGGHTASHLARWYRLALLDLSEPMLELSRQLNPGCEHLRADMRSARLGRRFDAVLVHEALKYLTTEHDVLATMRTAHRHCRPGGVVLLVPDDTTETWQGGMRTGGLDLEDRSVRYLAWSYDPDPTDTTYTTSYAFLFRQDDRVTSAHDDHVLGLFPRSTWLELMREAGFSPRVIPSRDCCWRQDELFAGTCGAQGES